MMEKTLRTITLKRTVTHGEKASFPGEGTRDGRKDVVLYAGQGPVIGGESSVRRKLSRKEDQRRPAAEGETCSPPRTGKGARD